MEQYQLNFNTNAKLEKLIGRELITNNVIAIFELIKNSYDAFAHRATITFENFIISYDDMQKNGKMEQVISNDNSRIIIDDDGFGMSFEDIKQKWMEIGTTSKEDQYVKIAANDANDKRVINGEKGIGRFGTDRLGAMLHLVSIGNDGYEKSTIDIDWNQFDNHEITIQDVKFECYVEHFNEPQKTGLTLEITQLRDMWTKSDIMKLKRHLSKLISPFSQEQEQFKIFLNYNHQGQERIVNDSFEYATTGIEASIDKRGVMGYSIYTSLDEEKKQLLMPSPSFGPVRLKILYMDRAAKIIFTKKTGTSTKDYGNIKVFRDNFRVLPYGERENDWLGIDNIHAQGTFRTFGTRDLVGYVQISKIHNTKLRDATSRQGLNEDIKEFQEFKAFIWRCIDLLQSYVFKQLKQESEKQGAVITEKVKEIKQDITDFKREIPLLYDDIRIPEKDKRLLVAKTTETLEVINQNIQFVEQANRHLSTRIKVMEKTVSSGNRVFTMLHAVKNRLVTLEAIMANAAMEAEKRNIPFDRAQADKALSDIEKMVLSAMRRISPQKARRDTIILSHFVKEFIEESKEIYQDVQFIFEEDKFYRIFVNVEDLRISLENLLDNAVKAMQSQTEKKIMIYLTKEEKSIKLYFEDNGHGIPPENAPFIFNVSYTTTNGSGFGLPSVLDFMKSEGGDINLLEQGNLKGASFELTFPLKGGLC